MNNVNVSKRTFNVQREVLVSLQETRHCEVKMTRQATHPKNMRGPRPGSCAFGFDPWRLLYFLHHPPSTSSMERKPLWYFTFSHSLCGLWIFTEAMTLHRNVLPSSLLYITAMFLSDLGVRLSHRSSFFSPPRRSSVHASSCPSYRVLHTIATQCGHTA